VELSRLGTWEVGKGDLGQTALSCPALLHPSLTPLRSSLLDPQQHTDLVSFLGTARGYRGK
jgi:hypothetical protein